MYAVNKHWTIGPSRGWNTVSHSLKSVSKSVSMFISSVSDSNNESAYVSELYAGDGCSNSSGDDGTPIIRYGECVSSMKSVEVSIISIGSHMSSSAS